MVESGVDAHHLQLKSGPRCNAGDCHCPGSNLVVTCPGLQIRSLGAASEIHGCWNLPWHSPFVLMLLAEVP